MDREVVLDTETTGMEPAEGHRLVEIGCVELLNHLPTGNVLHLYLNPERDVPADAVAVHGLTTEFLADKPTFAEKAAEFLEFIGDSPLIIHNAAFDMKFLNAELETLGFAVMPMNRAIDTVQMARRKFPGQAANLDALCRRFDIDNTSRTLHGALLDAQLLAEVYLELIGGRQRGLGLEAARPETGPSAKTGFAARPAREPRPHAPPAEELAAHEALLDGFKASPLWRQG